MPTNSFICLLSKGRNWIEYGRSDAMSLLRSDHKKTGASVLVVPSLPFETLALGKPASMLWAALWRSPLRRTWGRTWLRPVNNDAREIGKIVQPQLTTGCLRPCLTALSGGTPPGTYIYQTGWSHRWQFKCYTILINEIKLTVENKLYPSPFCWRGHFHGYILKKSQYENKFKWEGKKQCGPFYHFINLV